MVTSYRGANVSNPNEAPGCVCIGENAAATTGGVAEGPNGTRVRHVATTALELQRHGPAATIVEFTIYQTGAIGHIDSRTTS